MRIFHFRNILWVACILIFASACEIRSRIVNLLTPAYEAEGNPSELKAEYSGPDEKRPRIKIELREVASGFKQITDIHFLPVKKPIALICLKTGELFHVDLTTGKKEKILNLSVKTKSELGLLGVTAHPDFKNNLLIYINYTPEDKNRRFSRVESYKLSSLSPSSSQAKRVRVIMEVEQPFVNHDAGQLAFGPDGYLYIGWGDGGWRFDPENNAQNTRTFLGSMLRVDINVPINSKKPYAIPADNPFLKNKNYKPEMFAIGLRNPWRYSFDPMGRLIVADVGQDKYEEVSIVPAGSNMGWKHREAFHCFNPTENCRTAGLTEPVYEYPRAEGRSITGGYVYTGGRVEGLTGKYIFADFMSGRIWAIDLPNKAGQKVKKVYSLGKWPILISTFGRDANGEVYAGDYGSGKIFRLADG